MSTRNPWEAERAATRAFAELLDRAEDCRDRYLEANMQLPEPLRRFFGLTATSEIHGRPSAPINIPPPQYPRPPLAADDWVWVPQYAVKPITAVGAALAGEKSPLKTREVIDRVLKLLPHVHAGSIANLFSKLSDKTIIRHPEGWLPNDSVTLPIWHKERLWGPPEVFQKEEMAAYRRDAIIYLLGQFESGLQIVQIVEQLEQLPWMRAIVNKDLVKDDMEKLQEMGSVRRRGNSRKWELSPT